MTITDDVNGLQKLIKSCFKEGVSSRETPSHLFYRF